MAIASKMQLGTGGSVRAFGSTGHTRAVVTSSFDSIAGILGVENSPTLHEPGRCSPDQSSTSGKDWNPVRLKEALSHIPADYQAEWFKVGAAIHHASDGSQEGFDLWDDWSRTTKRGNYDPERQRYMWDRYFDGSGRITVRTIYALRKEHLRK